MDSLIWFYRLERIALVEVCMSMFACLGAPQQSYNVGIALFTIYSTHQRIGRINALSGVLHLVSFLADIIVLSVCADSWAAQRHEFAFSMALMIINLFIKAVALLVISLIYGQLGQSRIPIQYTAHQYARVYEEETELGETMSGGMTMDGAGETDRAHGYDGAEGQTPPGAQSTSMFSGYQAEAFNKLGKTSL